MDKFHHHSKREQDGNYVETEPSLQFTTQTQTDKQDILGYTADGKVLYRSNTTNVTDTKQVTNHKTVTVPASELWF